MGLKNSELINDERTMISIKHNNTTYYEILSNIKKSRISSTLSL